MKTKQIIIIATISCPPIVSVIEIISEIINPDYPFDANRCIEDLPYKFAKENIERLLFNIFTYNKEPCTYEYADFMKLIYAYNLWSKITKITDIIRADLPEYAVNIQSITIVDFSGLLTCQYV